MTDRDLFPRKFHLFGKDGTHYAVAITPRWDLKNSQGPDHPQSFAQDPRFTASVTVNEIPVSVEDLKSVAVGSRAIRISPVPSNEEERLQDGSVIDQGIARSILNHYEDVIDEVTEVWFLDQKAEKVVDRLLSDSQ